MNFQNRTCSRRKQKGIALFISMIFITIFSTLAIAMFRMSSSNVIAANNFQQANDARSSAESGLEMLRYYIEQITIDSTISKENRFAILAGRLIYLMNVGSNNYPVYYHDSSEPHHIHIGYSNTLVMLNSAENRGFLALITPDGTNGVNIRVTGRAGSLERTIASGFTYGTRPNSVFDFGVATKGALILDGGTLTSTVTSHSDVYIESLNDPAALGVLKNKSAISGVAKIVNASATITANDIKGTVGGLSGQDAIDNSIEIGVTPTEFPYPNATYFEQYATGGYYSGGSTLTNQRIAAGSDLTFTGNTTINGILYIEEDCNIEFGGNVTINGMIVCAGDVNDNSGTNSLSFTGSVDSHVLPAGSEYDAMREETGTFIMAPGYDLSFTGSFGTVNGVIAGNGISFSGNAGGTVMGSVINYSDNKMTVVGSSDIEFNRSGFTEIPAGFVQETVMHYNPAAYDEVL
jgi:hypothetical protein